jgi:Zn-dependent membrane protease YugP
MRRGWIIAAVLICLIALLFISLRVSTVRAISRIEALEGRTGDFSDLTKTIYTRYSSVNSPEGLERARTVLGLESVTNLSVVRFNGEGLPYYYGYVAFDTNKQHVVRAVVDQLW